MVKIKELVLELFDNPYSFTTVIDRAEYKEFEFNANGRSIVVDITIMEKDTWEVSFHKKGKISDADKYPRYTLTNNGDQFKIFSTVIDIIKHFISKQKDLRVLEFNASKVDDEVETGRGRLYNSMVKKLSSENGFDFEIDDDGEYINYRLTKKKNDIIK